MRLFLISDNTDTLTGMRLAGVEGVMAKDRTAVSDALESVLDDGNIAAVLINKSLFVLCEDIIQEFKKAHSSVVITQIPDRGNSGSGDSLAKGGAL